MKEFIVDKLCKKLYVIFLWNEIHISKCIEKIKSRIIYVPPVKGKGELPSELNYPEFMQLWSNPIASTLFEGGLVLRS